MNLNQIFNRSKTVGVTFGDLSEIVCCVLKEMKLTDTVIANPELFATFDPLHGINKAHSDLVTLDDIKKVQCCFNDFINTSPIVVSIVGCVASLIVEETVQLSITPIVAGVWSSNNELFATVSETGLVTAIGAGTVIITFTPTNTNYSVDTCEMLIALA